MAIAPGAEAANKAAHRSETLAVDGLFQRQGNALQQRRVLRQVPSVFFLDS